MKKDDRSALSVGVRKASFVAALAALAAIYVADVCRGDYVARNPATAKIENTDIPWLFSSAAVGVGRIAIPLQEKGAAPQTYTLRLAFIEEDGQTPGRRVFDVCVGKETVLENFEIMKDAGGTGRALVKEFKGIRVFETIEIEFVPNVPRPEPDQAPLLSGLEVLLETATP